MGGVAAEIKVRQKKTLGLIDGQKLCDGSVCVRMSDMTSRPLRRVIACVASST